MSEKAPTKLSAAEQDVADQSRQLRTYRRHHREQIKLHLVQPHEAEWRELARRLARMTLDDGDALVGYVRNARWLLDANLATRQAALSVISGRLITLRLINGYPPIDDALPGEPDTVFQVVREALKVMTGPTEDSRVMWVMGPYETASFIAIVAGLVLLAMTQG